MAADVGINVSLNGEQKFKNSLKDITQQGKTLDSEMKKVSSTFDENTSAMDKYKATSEVLTKQVENQRNKVDVLTAQYEKYATELGESDRKTLALKEQLNKATTELNRMEGQLKDMGSPLKALGDDMKAAGDKISAAGDKISGIGKGLTAGVTAPILGVGAAAMAAWKEYDEAADNIVKATGATGDTLEGLTDSMNNIATSIPVSFDQASAAVGEVNTRFGSTGEELEAISTAFLKFAELNGISDVGSAIDTVQSSMAAWKIETEDTGAVLDTLNKIAQDTGTDAVSLADTLQSNVTTLQDMGYSYSDAATLLGQLGKEGIDTSAVMTGLNKAFLEGAKEGKSAKDVIAELTKTMTSSDKTTDAYAAAIELFGKKAGPQLAGALADGRLSLDALGTSIQDNIGNIDETFEATLDPIDKMQMSMNELKIVGADVGSILMEAAVPVLQQLGDIVGTLRDKWEGLSPQMQETIIKGAGIAAIVGPLVTVIGGVVSGIGSIVGVGGSLLTFIGGLTGATGAATAAAGGAAVAAGGVGAALLPIIGIIGGVVAAGALIVTHWDELKGVAESLYGKVSETWAGIQSAVEEHGGGVQGFLSLAGETIQSGWNTMWTTVSDFTSTTLGTIMATVEENGGGIEGLFNTYMGLYETAWTAGWNAIDSVTGGKLTEIADSITNTFSDLVSSATSWGSDMLNNFRSGIESAWNWVKGSITSIGQGISDRLGFSVPKIGPLSDADTWMPDMMQLLAQGIRDNAHLVTDATRDVASTMFIPNTSAANEAQIDTARELGRLNDAMEGGATNVTVMLAGDASKMLRVLSVENNRRSMATGFNALNGGLT